VSSWRASPPMEPRRICPGSASDINALLLPQPDKRSNISNIYKKIVWCELIQN
jgi:hypothetical protein